MGLILNFSPIQFDDCEIRVGRLPYGNDGDQVLKQLRLEHFAAHVFRREGPEGIFAVSAVKEAPLIGAPATVRLKEHIKLAAALIRNTLLNRLVDLGGVSRRYEPIEVISRKDLLRLRFSGGNRQPWA